MLRRSIIVTPSTNPTTEVIGVQTDYVARCNPGSRPVHAEYLSFGISGKIDKVTILATLHDLTANEEVRTTAGN